MDETPLEAKFDLLLSRLPQTEEALASERLTSDTLRRQVAELSYRLATETRPTPNRPVRQGLELAAFEVSGLAQANDWPVSVEVDSANDAVLLIPSRSLVRGEGLAPA